MGRGATLVAPAYLPPHASSVLPWARRYVVKVSARDAVPLEDLWDEAMGALIRATVYHDPAGKVSFVSYACIAIERGCWRYVARAQSRMHKLGRRVALDSLPCDHTTPRHGTTVDPGLWLPSVEAEALAREAAQQRMPQDSRTSRTVPSMQSQLTGCERRPSGAASPHDGQTCSQIAMSGACSAPIASQQR